MDQSTSDAKLAESTMIARLKDRGHYKFLGVRENLKQDDKLVWKCATEVYEKRILLIWSSPFSDYENVLASNQFALPSLTYLLRTQQWPIA